MYRLTGYVKNEYDGSVICEVQGKDEDINMFITTINNGRFIEVTDIEREQIALVEDERSFERY
jgi:acylphosphatase